MTTPSKFPWPDEVIEWLRTVIRKANAGGVVGVISPFGEMPEEEPDAYGDEEGWACEKSN